jgi:CRISPR system Cascade subunit CasD
VTSQLVFTLAAPYGAFAVTFNAANAAVKATRLDPPKSALVGLLGAALGLERLALNKLADRLFVAVRAGLRPRPDPRPDYHTITPPVPPRNTGPWTRFEELRPALSGLADTGAILSARHHWQTGLWTVAAARRGAGGPTLDELRDALVHPRWPLYVGRKACGLGLPPDPEIIEAPGPAEALNSYGWPWTRHPRLRECLAELRETVEKASGFELRYDLDYPGAPQTSLEIEVFDEPFHGGSEAQLIRGFRPRRVGIASTPVA